MNTKNQLKILLVEDEPIAMMVHQCMLNNLDCNTDSAEDGYQALHLASSHRYDLILLDIGLPDINGFQVAFNLRELERTNKCDPTYIVGLTAYPLEEIREKSIISGIDELIQKPASTCQFQSLLSKISLHAHFEKQGSSQHQYNNLQGSDMKILT